MPTRLREWSTMVGGGKNIGSEAGSRIPDIHTKDVEYSTKDHFETTRLHGILWLYVVLIA